MAAVVRAILWVLLVVAPGGVFLLPLLVGDAVARRKREQSRSDAGAPETQPQAVDPVNPHLAAPASGH